MKKGVSLAAFFILLFLIANFAYAEKQSPKQTVGKERIIYLKNPTEPNLPDFLAIIVIEKNGEPYTQGNGFLVNKKYGLVATVVHVALCERYDNTRKIRIFIGGKNYEAETDLNMIDADKDIAILKLKITEKEANNLPEPAEFENVVWLKKLNEEKEGVIEMVGCKLEKSPNAGILQSHYKFEHAIKNRTDIVCNTHETKLIGINIPYNKLPIDVEDTVRVALTKAKLERGKKIELEDKLFFYRNFWIFEIVTDKSEDPSGYSGSPLLNQDGKIVAIISLGDSHFFAAIFAKELSELIKKTGIYLVNKKIIPFEFEF